MSMPRSSKVRNAVIATAVALVLGVGGAIAYKVTHAGPGKEFVTRDGSSFMLDGKTFAFDGTNTYRPMLSGNEIIDKIMAATADNHFRVLRTWAFNDIGQQDGTDSVDKFNTSMYFHYWDGKQPAFNDGEDGLQRLDYVIASASKHHVKLIMPLVNNWGAFGGMDQYVRWAGLTYHSDFYTDAKVRQWYKDWATHLLNRVNTVTGVKYKDDPTIMAWELANEPRCGASGLFPRDPGCNSDMLTAWVDEMSTYIKSIDDNHLVGTGDEGFLCDQPAGHWTRNCADGVDAARFAALPTIDYLSYHLYPDHWGTDAAWGTQWIELHNALARQIHKPAVLGEFGWQGKADRNVVYNDWLSTFIRTGGTGALYWLLSDIRGDGTLYPDYDGFTVYCPSPVCTLIPNARETTRTNNKQLPPGAANETAP